MNAKENSKNLSFFPEFQLTFCGNKCNLHILSIWSPVTILHTITSGWASMIVWLQTNLRLNKDLVVCHRNLKVYSIVLQIQNFTESRKERKIKFLLLHSKTKIFFSVRFSHKIFFVNREIVNVQLTLQCEEISFPCNFQVINHNNFPYFLEYSNLSIYLYINWPTFARNIHIHFHLLINLLCIFFSRNNTEKNTRICILWSNFAAKEWFS